MSFLPLSIIAYTLSLSPLSYPSVTGDVKIDPNPSYECVIFNSGHSTGASPKVKMDTNPSYDSVSFGTAKQKDPQVKTDMNPSYDSVTFSTARQPVTSTDTIDTNMNYCYSTLPTATSKN